MYLTLHRLYYMYSNNMIILAMNHRIFFNNTFETSCTNRMSFNLDHPLLSHDTSCQTSRFDHFRSWCQLDAANISRESTTRKQSPNQKIQTNHLSSNPAETKWKLLIVTYRFIGLARYIFNFSRMHRKRLRLSDYKTS